MGEGKNNRGSLNSPPIIISPFPHQYPAKIFPTGKLKEVKAMVPFRKKRSGYHREKDFAIVNRGIRQRILKPAMGRGAKKRVINFGRAICLMPFYKHMKLYKAWKRKMQNAD